MKQALGLAVSGTEVRLAHLVSHKGQIRIEGLERAKLKTTLEHQSAENQKSQYAEPEAKDAFGIKESLGEKENGENAQRQDGANLEILYRLLEKYTRKKVKIAFNIPLSMVSYQRQDAPFAAAAQGLTERPGGTDKEAGPILGYEQLKSKDGATISMLYEKHPPTLSLLREVNSFVRDNLYLGLMDTTEAALANLARGSLELEADAITTIIYIEEDFSRLIFLRGEDLLHVSSIIHEEAASPEVLEVIYRKLIYEQDEAQIPPISMILLAGKSSRINAGDFFASRFERATVRYLASDKLGNFPSTETQRQTFSEFAVPISLAWKMLAPKNPAFIPLNLMPQELLDQQQVLKMAYHGYILLALTGLAAFFFTWQIVQMRGKIGTTHGKNTQLEQQIKSNQATVDRVLNLEDQSKRLHKNLALSDSLSKGHGEFLVFLQKLNQSVERTGNLWVEEILKQKEGFTVKGTSLNREKIPILAEKLEQASLRKVTRTEAGSRKLFSFELERFNTPDNVQFPQQGISMIDAAQYTRNGNLILSKEGVRAASAPPQFENSLPGAGQNESLSRQQPWLDEKVKRSDTAGRSPQSKPVIKQAFSTQPASGPEAGTEPPSKKSKDTGLLQASRQINEAAATNLPANSDLPSTENRFATANYTTTADEISDSDGMAGTTVAEASPRVTNGFAKQPEPQASSREVVASELDGGGPPEIYRGYTIEAITSYTKDLAEQYAVAYRKQGFNAAIETYSDGRSSNKRYRVLVGIFPNRPAAEKKAEQISGLLSKEYRIIGLK